RAEARKAAPMAPFRGSRPGALKKLFHSGTENNTENHVGSRTISCHSLNKSLRLIMTYGDVAAGLHRPSYCSRRDRGFRSKLRSCDRPNNIVPLTSSVSVGGTDVSKTIAGDQLGRLAGQT